MNRRVLYRTLSLITAVALALSSGGCSDNKLFSTGDTEQFSTLTVHYADPGPSFSPCDDRLPVLDGIAADDEWSAAEPLMLHLDGASGTGGDDLFVELRAIWTDEGKFLGGDDRIYFLVRFEDDDDNSRADLLVYGTGVTQTFEDGIANVAGAPSPIPVFDTVTRQCDDTILNSDAWTRINPDGREDQVMFILAEGTNPTDLIAANQRLLSVVGKEIVNGTSVPGASDLDVWIWRASRTNLHPVPMFADWKGYRPDSEFNFQLGEINRPDPVHERFQFTAGFCEDLFVASGQLNRDIGQPPFIKNFTNRDPIPDKITQIESRARQGDDGNEGFGGGGEDPTVINGDLPKDRVLWWPTAKTLNVCDSIATSRVSIQKLKWSDELREGQIDQVYGWALQTPLESARDVRSAGLFEEIQDKAFPTRAVETMRALDTGNPDDIAIEPGVKQYRITLGIFDNSGKRASGSTVINLKFQPIKPAANLPRRRC